jgi:hypothetical protein
MKKKKSCLTRKGFAVYLAENMRIINRCGTENKVGKSNPDFRRPVRVLPDACVAARLGAARRDPKAMAEEEWRRIVADRMLKQSAACSRPTGHVGFVVSVQLPVCVGSSDRIGSGVILVTFVQDRRDS